jgi:hypothetical protein
MRQGFVMFQTISGKANFIHAAPAAAALAASYPDGIIARAIYDDAFIPLRRGVDRTPFAHPKSLKRAD